jgi:hypothetical protein
VLDGAGQQTLSGFNYLSGTPNGVARFELKNAGGLRMCSHLAVADTFLVSTAVTIDQTCGGFQVQANGPVVTAPGSSVANYLWEIRHATGTSLVRGGWAPSYTDFDTPDAIVNDTLAYQNLRFYASNAFRGDTRATGQLWIEGGTPVEVRLAGHRVRVGGELRLRSNVSGTGGLLIMDRAADTLEVTGDANFEWDASAQQAGRLTAGVLRVGGTFGGNGFSASGTHKVVLVPGPGRARPISGMNYVSRGGQSFRRLELAGGDSINLCSHIRVTDSLVVRANTTLYQGCGGFQVRADAELVAEPSSRVTPYLVEVRGANGLQGVANGTWGPEYTDYDAPGQPVKPTLGYRRLRFFAGTHALSGATTATQELYLEGAGVDLDLGGHTLVVNGRTWTNTGSTLTMTNPLDTLITGEMSFDGGGSHAGRLTAGAIRASGIWRGGGAAFAPSGTQTVFLEGTSGQQIQNMNFFSNAAGRFQNLVALTAGTLDACAHVQVAGTFSMPQTGTTLASCSGFHFSVLGDLVTAAGTSIAMPTFRLGNASGTQNVGGAFSPALTVIEIPFTGAELKQAPGIIYRDMEFDRSMTLTRDFAVTGSVTLTGASTNLTLGGHTLTVSNTFNLDANATVTMTSAGDSIDVGGQVFWDGGGVMSGKLTSGTVVARGDRFVACNYVGTGTNTVVFARTGAQTGVECNGAATPFANVVVQGGGANWNCSGTVNGALLLKAGASLTGCGTLTLQQALTTEAGSSFTMNRVDLGDASGTQFVSGAFSPPQIVFGAVNAYIKPDLAYNYVQVQATTGLQDNTTFNGSVDIVGSTLFSLNGHKLTVNPPADGSFNQDNPARVAMTQPGDTLVVNGQTSNIFWDGAADDQISDGVILFQGDRFVATSYDAVPGSAHKLVFTGDGSGAATVSVEGPPQFANLEVAATAGRGLNFVSGGVINGRFDVKAPVALTGSSTLTLGGGFDLQAVPGGTMNYAGTIRLGGNRGTADYQGAPWNVTTTVFEAAAPVTAAINPAFTYGNVNVESGLYQLAGRTNLTGHLYVSGTGTTLSVAGQKMKVGQEMEIFSGGAVSMTSEGDSLGVGSFARFQGNAGVSTLSAGTVAVDGNQFYFNNGGTSATGTFKVLMNAQSGSGQQSIELCGGGSLQDVEIASRRGVNFNCTGTVKGALAVTATTSATAPVTLSSNGTLVVLGPISAVPGSNLSFSTLQIEDPAGLVNVNGSYSATTTRLAASGAPVLKPTAAGFAYTNVEITAGSPSVQGGGAIALGGYLDMAAGTSFLVPTGSRINGSVGTSGLLEFAGTHNASNPGTTSDLTVRSGGTARALSGQSGDWVDFRSIFVNGGGTLDNSAAPVGAAPAGGFRRAATGSFQNSGSLIGPAPATR